MLHQRCGAATLRRWSCAVVCLAGLAAAPAMSAPAPLFDSAITDLASKDDETRGHAAITLGNANEQLAQDPAQAAKAIHGLARLLTNRSTPNTREWAVWALGRLHGEPQQVLAQLQNALHDDATRVRLAAVKALPEYGADALAAAPSLLDAMKDRDSDVREASVKALVALHPSPDSVLPALAAALLDDSWRVHRSAGFAIAGYGADAAQVLPALMNALQNRDASRRASAAFAMGKLGPRGTVAADLLVAALGDTDASVRLAAAAALAPMGLGRERGVATGLALLTDNNDDTRKFAAEVLGAFGVAARPALPELTRTLEDRNRWVQEKAAVALAQVARGLAKAHDFDAIEPLAAVEAAISRSGDLGVRGHGLEVHTAVADLQASLQRNPKALAWRAARAHPALAVGGAMYGIVVVLILVLYGLIPLSVLRLDEAMLSLPRIRLPGWMGAIEISLSHLLPVGWLGHSERSLDAWVRANAPVVRGALAGELRAAPTDAAPRSVVVDGRPMPELLPEHLRGLSLMPAGRILIVGGTHDARCALTARIVSWALGDDPAARLRPHPMLPVEVMNDSATAPGKLLSPFGKAVLDGLAIAGLRPSESLVLALIERGRILPIVRLPEGGDAGTMPAFDPRIRDAPVPVLLASATERSQLAGFRGQVVWIELAATSA